LEQYMPVPTVLADLSTTLSNNSPPGPETVGTNLDDYLRAGFGLLAQVNANKLETSTASSTYAPIASPTFTGTVTGTFSGSGAALTALNATQLTSGTVPSARVAGAYTAVTAIGNTTSAVSFAAAGNVTVAAPSSGTTFSVIGGSTGGVYTSGNVLGNYNGFICENTNASGYAVLQLRSNSLNKFLRVSSTNVLEIVNSANSAVLMSLADAGNLTIASPSSGNTLALNVLTTNNAFTYTDGTCSGLWNVSGASGVVIGNSTNHQFNIRTNNADRIAIAAAGNVTINTPSSGTALTVAGGGASITGTTALDATSTVGGLSIGYRNLPQSASTTAATTDVGKSILATTTITIPNSTFAAGDAFTVVNNSAAAITLTSNPTTTHIAGTATTGSARTIPAWGVCGVYFVSSTVVILSGNVS
jgi:hypothetical protein